MTESEPLNLRHRMVTEQIESRGIRDPRVLAAMRSVPRHVFVDPEFRAKAYTDGPLPAGHGQTISQPYIVALMTALLRLQGGEKVLEVGTGSGYQAAILAQLAGEVHTIEYHPELAQAARERLAALRLDKVRVHVGDGSLGLPEQAPFQGILVTASAPRVPAPLLEQLDLGGRLVLPVGGRGGQDLRVCIRSERGIEEEVIAPVAFVPLRGAYGWPEEETW